MSEFAVYSNGVKAVFGMFKTMLISGLTKQKMPPFLAKRSKEDLIVLTSLIESGAVKPVIDRRHPMAEVAEAVNYLEAGHARGKVVITL